MFVGSSSSKRFVLFGREDREHRSGPPPGESPSDGLVTSSASSSNFASSDRASALRQARCASDHREQVLARRNGVRS